jgi:hypothetical protein
MKMTREQFVSQLFFMEDMAARYMTKPERFYIRTMIRNVDNDPRYHFFQDDIDKILNIYEEYKHHYREVK